MLAMEGGALAPWQLVAAAAALCAAALVRGLRAPQPAYRERTASSDAELDFDYVIVGGGPSGCYLAGLLARRHPDRTVCVVNPHGAPRSPVWRTYMVNLIGVVMPWLVPGEEYRLRSHAKQFVNCTLLGGNSNINAAVGPVPEPADVAASLGDRFTGGLKRFVEDGELDAVSRPAPPTPGLERLSSDLRSAGAPGGGIRVFADGWARIHPADMLPAAATLLLGTARRVLFEGRRARTVECASGALVHARRKIFLCGGALESPKLLMRSGVGPRELVERLLGGPERVVLANEAVGANLQDHWVGRARARVPPSYAFPRLYPVVLGYKHRFRGVAVGFGKMQLAGANVLSFATAHCRNPGRVILTADGRLEPYLPVGVDDLRDYHEDVAALVALLRDKLGVQVDAPKAGPLAPNWHLSCSLSLGTVCREEDFGVKGLEGLHVADVSCLREIVPMNTQMLSYLVPFLVAEQED